MWVGIHCIRTSYNSRDSPIEVIEFNRVPAIDLSSTEIYEFGSGLTELEQKWLLQEVNNFLPE